MIVLGGGVAYLLIPGDGEPTEEAIEESAEGEHEEEHAEEGGHGSAPAQPQYVKMEVLTLPVVRGEALNHYLHVEASLQSPDKQSGREIQSSLPHLRDAIIRDLFRSPLSAARGAEVDGEVLKRRLLQAARKVLGAAVVADVLLVNVIRGRR